MTAVESRPDQAAPVPRPPVPGRVTFNRPPRLRPALSVEAFEVPAPAPPAQKPVTTLSSGLIVPLIAVFAMGGMFLVGGMAQGSMGYLVVVGIALALGSALPTGWMFFEDRRKFRQKARDQVEQHGRRLRNAELELARLREEEQSLREDQDPAPAHLVHRALTRGRRLWERRLADEDFLVLRLGSGLATSLLKIDYHADQVPTDQGELPPELARLLREGQHIADQYRRVPDVPIRFDLRSAGAVGFAGWYPRTGALARSVLAQAALHHSPEDLRIVGFLGKRPLVDWAWLKWLPHARNGGASEAPASLAWNDESRLALSRWLFEELTSRKRAIEEAGAMVNANEINFTWLLVFVDDMRGAHSDQGLRLALADGKRLRVAVLGLADDVASVPGGCGGVAALEGRQEGLLTYAESMARTDPLQCVPDALEPEAAERLARALAPLVVVDDSADGQSGDIPARITFFESLGIASVEQLDMTEEWRPRARTELLRTPLGPIAGGDLLWLDLKEQSQNGQGPHGLVAGTTGAGKSELLLTFIAGLALRHPPDVVNFVLVDYKGGDAFQAVLDLPHTISLITDLDRHLAARALQTLRSEIKRREHRMLELRASGVTSLTDFQQRRGDAEPMPFLVIVVDEFARLKDDLPEFINGLIDVARVGRSLGVHLILATQTPSGTVDDQIQKNSNFGVCLRVRDQSDSKQVIGEPDAALLPGSLPGRGYFRAGLDPVRLFQTARVGAAYHARSSTASLDVEPFEPLLDAPSRRLLLNGRTGSTADRTEVRALVQHLREASITAGNMAVPWPAPLPEVVSLIGTPSADVEPELQTPTLLPLPPGTGWAWPIPPGGEWLVAQVGLVDEPTQLAQRPFRLDVSRNCIIFGGAGSGKSTTLRTLATSLALTHSPRDLHIYALDFDARTLSMLSDLPHCGEAGVFFPRDTVRIRRLFRMLEHELVQRRESGVTNLRQQRRAVQERGVNSFPFILVLIDNFPAFRETFEEEEDMTRSPDSMVSDLAALMRDGAAAGIQFVLTASVPNAVTSSVGNSAEVRIVLRQADSSDYTTIGRIEHLPERIPPGRGFAAGTPPREFQIALLPDEAEAATEMAVVGGGQATADLFARLRQAAGGVRPVAIQDLPAWLTIDDPRLALPPSPSLGLPLALGLDDERSRAVVIDLAELQHLLVMGPPGSGKTSLLTSAVLQVLERDVECFLVVPRPSALAELGEANNVRKVARNLTQLGELVEDLEVLVDERRETMRAGSAELSDRLLLMLDDYELLRQDDDFMDIEIRLGRLARRGSTVGLHVVLGGLNIELRDARDDLVRYISQLRVGVMLQPDVEFDGDIFSVRLRRMVQAAPVGRGYFVVRQQQRLFQAATPQFEGESLSASVRRRLA